MIAENQPNRIVAGRSITVFPDDIFIVSYPKSGNTWLRFLVGNLICPDEPINFANIETRVPDIYRNSDAELRGLPGPRILKSHECFDPRYTKVIYVVRDPRDVAVSYYHYHLKQRWIEVGFHRERFIRRFVAGDLRYGSWGANVNSWLRAAHDHHPSLLVLQYERLLTQPELEVEKIARFLNANTSEPDLARVIELSSADHMRRLEKAQADVWKTIKHSRREIPFIRSAKSGNWKSELSSHSARLIAARWPDLMKSLKYIG
jgi:hypothetical protein